MTAQDKRASDDLRTIIKHWFGSLAADEPKDFLWERGYDFRINALDQFVWSKPTPSHCMRYEEFVCLSFLVNEWGHGFKIPDMKPKEPIMATLERWFGPKLIDQMQQPLFFLVSRGYKTNNDFTLWFPPTHSHTISYEEGVCLNFLSAACGAVLITTEPRRD